MQALCMNIIKEDIYEPLNPGSLGGLVNTSTGRYMALPEIT